MKHLLIAALMIPLMVACGEPKESQESIDSKRKKSANCQIEVNDFRKYDLFIYSRTGEVVRLTKSSHLCTEGGAQVLIRFDTGDIAYAYASELSRAKIPE